MPDEATTQPAFPFAVADPPRPDPAMPLALSLDYGGQAVRMVGTPERPEWVAADLGHVLGLSKVRNTVAAFDDDERGGIARDPTAHTLGGGMVEWPCDLDGEKGLNRIDTLGGRQLLTVTEPGLYRLIFLSRKPEAKAFRRWVLHDVLPSIRRHGVYPPPPVRLADAGPAIPRNGRPRGSYQTPKVGRHASGLARCRVKGRDVYLGRYGSPESEERYKSILADWTPQMPASAPPAPVPLPPPPPPATTPPEVVPVTIMPVAPLKSIAATIDPGTKLIPLKAVRDIPWLPHRPAHCTVFSWHLRGQQGVRLETICVGGKLYTSESAVLIYFVRTAQPNPVPDQPVVCRTPATTRQDTVPSPGYLRAMKVLDAAGLVPAKRQ